jgi:dimethylargininase
MTEPATLDGGDVLRVGRTFYVGLSQRTNAEGVAQLRQQLAPFGYDLRPVEVRACLHLKSAASWLGDDAVLVHRPWIDATALDGLRLIGSPQGEEHAANVLTIGNTVVMAAGFPRTAELIRNLGREVRPLEMTELMKAESGVTCSSVIFESEPAAY